MTVNSYRVLLASLLFCVFHNVEGSLSAQTTQTIRGMKPTLQSRETGDHMLLITYKGQNVSGDKFIGTINDKFSDFTAAAVTTSVNQYYYDHDGDTPASQPIKFVPGSFKITWKKSNGTAITAIGSTIAAAGIKAGEVIQAHLSANIDIISAYGHPLQNRLTINKTVSVSVGNVLGSIKTLSQTPAFSFAIDAGFPTTGFHKAQFDIVLKDPTNTNYYTWSSSNTAFATVNATNGRVTLINRGNGSNLVITATGKIGTPLAGHKLQYIIKTPIKWFINNPTPSSGTWSTAMSNVCKNLTSTTQEPGASFVTGTYNLANTWDLTAALFSTINNVASPRTMGSLFAEWGRLALYPNAGWRDAWYYTKQFYGQFPQVLNSTNGALTRDTGLTADRYVICSR